MATPYDDGSSTESEYYFDPAEATEQLAAYEWAHALDAPPSLQPPAGSEWSHGAAGGDAQPLALTRDCARPAAPTADTRSSNTSREPKLVSLREVKAPAGERGRELTTPRPQRKTGSQSFASLRENHRKVRREDKASSRRTEFRRENRSPVARPTAWTEHFRRRERSRSPARPYARRSRSRSPDERRWTSRAPHRSLTASGPQPRLQRSDKARHYEEQQYWRTYDRPRSPPRRYRSPPRPYQSTWQHCEGRDYHREARPRSMKFPPQANANFAHDFDRRVFKLKLLEADVDQHAASGLRTGESRLLQKRRQAIAAERADLMAIDLDRFERIYASTIVTQVELNRYQGDRDFAWKVVQFQRKLASLQGEAKFLSPKERDELQSRLDEEREHLVSQNPLMFHKVMSNQAGHRPNQEHYKPRKIVARATPRQTSEPSVSSRVVVGAALEIPQPKTTPWFVKG